MMKNKFIHVTEATERVDTLELGQMILEDAWIDRDTILVTCFPDYSAALSQKLNHKFSQVNDNELLENIQLEIRYPIMSQVWDRNKFEYVNYEVYLADWMAQNINISLKYLFITSLLQGKDYERMLRFVKNRLEPGSFRVACLYWDEACSTVPDYFIKKVNQNENGKLLFHWENSENPNW